MIAAARRISAQEAIILRAEEGGCEPNHTIITDDDASTSASNFSGIVCALSTCPGGRGVGEWRGTVTCDPALHAEVRVHAAGYCVCGHKAHGKHPCQWCNFLGELCRVTRLCGAAVDEDGLSVRA